MVNQEVKEKYREQTQTYRPYMWARPQGPYRKEEWSIGQQAEGARSRRMGAIYINIKSSSAKGRSLTLY